MREAPSPPLRVSFSVSSVMPILVNKHYLDPDRDAESSARRPTFCGQPHPAASGWTDKNFVYSIKTIFVLFLPLFGEQSLATLFLCVGYR